MIFKTSTDSFGLGMFPEREGAYNEPGPWGSNIHGGLCEMMMVMTMSDAASAALFEQGGE